MFGNHKSVTVHAKSQGNFVTSLDLMLEAYLKDMLGLLLPEAGFITEESNSIIKDINWVIDPIDGTGNFWSGYPYDISVALVRKTGETLFDVVYDKKNDKIYFASHNGGAFVQFRNKDSTAIHVNSLNDEGITLFVMPYNRGKTHRIRNCEKLYSFSSDIKRIGPSSLDICSVTEGRALYMSSLTLIRGTFKQEALFFVRRVDVPCILMIYLYSVQTKQ